MIYNGFKRINSPPLEAKKSTDTCVQDIRVDPELVDWRFKINNKQLYDITFTKPIESFLKCNKVNGYHILPAGIITT